MSMARKAGQTAAKRLDWLWAVILSLFSALVLLQTSPWVVQTPRNDSGIFLYFGAQIVRGRLPFVHLWDHKPPLVFYLDALGFILGGGSRWGVWAVEVVSLLAASLFAFFFLRRYFRTWPALLATAGMLANLAFVLEGGNLTEEYALVFQFAALFGFAGMMDRQKPGWRGYLVGAAMGCAFLLKQTLIGVWIAIAVYLLGAALFTRAWRGLRVLAQMLAGFVGVVLVSVAYFALRGALPAYWDVAFWYNFVYSNVASLDRLNSLLEELVFLNTRSGFFMLAAAAWFAGCAYVLLHHEPALWQATRRWVGLGFLAGALFFLWNGLFIRAFQLYAITALSPYRWSLIGIGLALLLVSLGFLTGWIERRVYPWLKAHQVACDAPALLPVYLALIGLPVDLLLVSVSGRGYLHYYLALFPSTTLLVAFLVWSLFSSISQRAERTMPVVLSAVLLLPVIYNGAAYTLEKIHPGADSQTTQTVKYIRANTHVGDTILLWGTQTGIYYLSGRDSPTRFVHQIPLFNSRYATPARIQEFLSDLQTKKPALIIDTRLPDMPLVYRAGDAAACGQSNEGVPSGLERVYAYICTNYESVGTIGKDSWIIYRYNPAVSTVEKPH